MIDSPAPRGAPPEDRHLFACLLAVATGDIDTETAIGLGTDELADLLHLYFPEIDITALRGHSFKGNVPANIPMPIV